MDTYEDNSVEARVQRGIEWLQSDEAREAFGPIDLGAIDWDRFDINSTQDCILGQLINPGDFYSGYGRVDSWEGAEDINWMSDHGFYAPDDSTSLEHAWREALVPAS